MGVGGGGRLERELTTTGCLFVGEMFLAVFVVGPTRRSGRLRWRRLRRQQVQLEAVVVLWDAGAAVAAALAVDHLVLLRTKRKKSFLQKVDGLI